MAELPRYQQTGRVFADVPQLDFANVRESFKRSQSMAAGLDRLSSFAGKFAEKAIEEQVQKSVVNNPITLEQLQEAEKSGITAEDLVKASGGGMLWQETMRKVQAEQLRGQLEVQANTEALKIKQMVDLGELTSPSEIKDKFVSLQTGMVKPLIGLDPESAIKFQHSTGGLIKNLEKAAYDKLADNYKVGKQVETGDYKKVALESIDTIFDTEVDPEIINAKVSLIRKTFTGLANEGGADFALTELRAIDKEIEERQVNSFAKAGLKNTFANDRFEAMTKIRNGDFGEKTAIFKSLPIELQTKIRVAISDSWTSLEQAKANKEKEDKSIADNKFRTNVVSKTSRGKSGKLNDYDNAFLSGALSFSEWKTANNPEGSVGDPLLISQIETKIARGIITNITQLPAGLSPKAIGNFNRLIGNQDSKDALKTIYIGANVPLDAFSFDTNQTARKTKIEGIFRDIRNQTDKNGNLLYPNEVQAAVKAVEMYNGDTDIVSSKVTQKAKLTAATKLIPKEDFDYDVVISKDKLKEIAESKISFMNRSERETWVKNVLAYQEARKKTGLSASSVEAGK
jgi:hypothetical protein